MESKNKDLATQPIINNSTELLAAALLVIECCIYWWAVSVLLLHTARDPLVTASSNSGNKQASLNIDSNSELECSSAASFKMSQPDKFRVWSLFIRLQSLFWIISAVQGLMFRCNPNDPHKGGAKLCVWFCFWSFFYSNKWSAKESFEFFAKTQRDQHLTPTPKTS